MKLAQVKIADLWCRLMHTAPSGLRTASTSAGHAGGGIGVSEAPEPFALRPVLLPCEAQDQRALLPVKDPGCRPVALLTTAERS